MPFNVSWNGACDITTMVSVGEGEVAILEGCPRFHSHKLSWSLHTGNGGVSREGNEGTPPDIFFTHLTFLSLFLYLTTSQGYEKPKGVARSLGMRVWTSPPVLASCTPESFYSLNLT